MAGRSRAVTPRSLQFRLSLWLTVAILAVAAIGAAYSYSSAFDEAIEMQDGELGAIAEFAVRADAAPAAGRAGTGEDADQLRLRVGRISRAGSNLPAELSGLRPDIAPGFHTEALGGTEWRIFVRSAEGERFVVAQPTAIRDDIAHDGAVRAAIPILALVPALLLIVAAIVGRMLGPLRRLAGDVDARPEHDLTPFQTRGLPGEIVPLVEAINRLFHRAGDAMTAQRRFIADAAHEL
ncbi:MAG: hypothetical protein J0H88_12970, partial [Sphingomonadales bacterium]|nr:hypothetical protein [Sphingomonadales bacterium]